VALAIRAPLDTAEEIGRQVTIRPNAIQTEYAELPSNLARWVKRRVDTTKLHHLAKLEAQAAKSRAEFAADVAEARARSDVKVNRAGVKLTSDDVAALVACHPDYVAARERAIAVAEEVGKRVVETEAMRDEAVGMIETIHAKREMLVSLGAHLRLEMQRDPMIRDRDRR
jgi:hypothetical protein